MGIAIDCMTSPPVAALRSANVTGVLRYLTWEHWWGGVSHAGFNPKLIRKPEYDTLMAAGIPVILNWEFDAADWTTGATGGQAHAAEAVRQARNLGYPTGRVIYGSADFDMTAAQWAAECRAYGLAFAAGVRSGGYLPGVYGPYDVLGWCQGIGFDRAWQARMSTSWSGGRNGRDWPGAHLIQRRSIVLGGVTVDVNDILDDTYGGGTMDISNVQLGDLVIGWVSQGEDVRTGTPAGPSLAGVYDRLDTLAKGAPVTLSDADRQALRAAMPSAAEIAAELDYDKLAAAIASHIQIR